MMSFQRRKCPYCMLIFNQSYITRHINACKEDKDKDISYDEYVPSEEAHSSKEYKNEHSSQGRTSSVSDSSDENNVDYEDVNLDDEIDNVFEEFNEEEDIINLNDTHLPANSNAYALLKWLCIFIAVWQYYFNLSDNSIEILLKFMKAFMTVLSEQCNVLKDFALSMPASLYTLNNFLGRNEQSFTKYVVCIRCYKLYSQEESYYLLRGEKTSKKCTNVLFPNHPQKQFRKKCGQPLLREIFARSGKKYLVPHKVYCYMPLKKSLEKFFNSPNFVKNCNSWRKRTTSENILSDIYDGAIWKEFHDPTKLNFFNNENNLALMLNVDWFCPYKHVRSVSVGAIYAVLLNLPRELRFKKENMILIGIIPNMSKEPSTNTFIKPFVDEMHAAWTDGLNITTKHGDIRVRCALLCVGCDIPASRKLCGFLGKFNFVWSPQIFMLIF